MWDWIVVYLVVFMFVFLFQFMVTFFDPKEKKDAEKQTIKKQDMSK